MNKLIFIIIGILLFSSCGNESDLASKLYAELVFAVTPNTLASKEQKAGWQSLFDGKTILGWHGYNMQMIPDVWIIEDGCLTTNSEVASVMQDLVTDDVYKDFAFSVEYKLTKSANSGIIYQIKEDTKYRRTYQTGPEVQLIDHENWPDKLENWQINGAICGMYPPKAEPHKPFGEWNHLLLVVKGYSCTVMINGVVIVSYEKNSDEWVHLRDTGQWANYPDFGRFDEGRIALQYHGDKVWFRNIKIKQL